MKRLTGRNLKPIIIILCCCLCVTITNCDNKLLAKHSVTSLNVERRPRSLVEPLRSKRNSEIPPPKNPDPNRSNELKNPVDNKRISKVNHTDKKPETKDLTSNNVIAGANASKVTTPGTIITTTSTVTRKPGISTNIQPPINTGALLRGASVFLGLSIVVIAYIIFRCARLNKNRTQMVRKYGILAHRQDVEMRPLPLDDEDEDDTTVFDASEVAAIHDKQRRST